MGFMAAQKRLHFRESISAKNGYVTPLESFAAKNGYVAALESGHGMKDHRQGQRLRES